MKQKLEDRINSLAPLVYIYINALFLVASVVLFILWYQQQQHVSLAARTANVAVAKVQQERIDSIRRNCNSQNLRHKHAIIALNKLLIKSGVKKARRKAAAAPVISLISALAPHQNCKALVARSVKTKTKLPAPEK